MIDAVILDIDGVLRRGKEPVPGSVEAVNVMIDRGMRIAYLSNNSTRTREVFMEELEEMGFPRSIMVTSAYATAGYLTERFGRSRCLVLGESGLHDELERAGHDAIQAGEGRGLRPLSLRTDASVDGGVPLPIEVDAVIVGMDRGVTYTRIADAMLAIRAGAMFIATNEDPSLPFENGMAIPGAGTIVAAVRRCTGVDPTVIGKPEPYSTRLAIAELGSDPSRVLMIGDRPDTDMEAGRRCGTKLALVLTGEVKDPGPVDYPVYPDLLTLARDQNLM